MEKAHNMWEDAWLEKKFWDEPVHTANYVNNLSSSSILGGVSPQEKWSDKNPLLSIYRCLDVKLICIFPKISDKS